MVFLLRSAMFSPVGFVSYRSRNGTQKRKIAIQTLEFGIPSVGFSCFARFYQRPSSASFFFCRRLTERKQSLQMGVGVLPDSFLDSRAISDQRNFTVCSSNAASRIDAKKPGFRSVCSWFALRAAYCAKCSTPCL